MRGSVRCRTSLAGPTIRGAGGTCCFCSPGAPIALLSVTENGAAFYGEKSRRGRMRPPRQVCYLAGHLKAAGEALERGADLRGCFVWSLVDNFEGARGCTPRFGIVHVDYRAQKRTVEDSEYDWAECSRRNGWIPRK